MLYSAPTWAPDLAVSRTGPKVLSSVQRLAALSSVCAYRSVSYEAGMVVARTIPITLMTEERFASFEAKRATWATGTDDGGPLPPGDPAEAVQAHDPRSLRTRVLAKWARDLGRVVPPAGSGREWTRVLIPPGLLSRWVSRSHREMTYHLTQLMTGHGCFNWFLQGVNRSPSVECSHCGPPNGYAEAINDAHHTLFRCEAFRRERERLVDVTGPFDPGGLVPKILENQANWGAVSDFASEVITTKESAERDRQFRQGVAPSRRRR